MKKTKTLSNLIAEARQIIVEIKAVHKKANKHYDKIMKYADKQKEDTIDLDNLLMELHECVDELRINAKNTAFIWDEFENNFK